MVMFYLPIFKVQTMDFFDKRQQLKKDFNEYYEKSLTKKYQPEVPSAWTMMFLVVSVSAIVVIK